jgi:hypothetical protein
MSVRDTNAASHHHTPLHSNPPPNHTAMPPHHVPILLLLLHLLTGASVAPAGAAAHSQPTHPLPARAAAPSATPPTVPALVQAVAPASRLPPPSSRPSLPRQTHPPTCAHPRRAALLPAGDLLQRSGPRLILLCIPAGAPSEAEGLEAAKQADREPKVEKGVAVGGDEPNILALRWHAPRVESDFRRGRVEEGENGWRGRLLYFWVAWSWQRRMGGWYGSPVGGIWISYSDIFFFPILGNGHPIGNSLRASKHWTKQSIPKVIQTQQTDPRY